MRQASSKRFLKLFIFVICSFALFAFPMLHVSALSASDFFYDVKFSDETYGPAVIVSSNDNAYVLTYNREAGDDDAHIMFNSGEDFTLTYAGEFVPGALSLWRADNTLLDIVHYLDNRYYDYPVQNEEITAVFYDRSSKLTAVTTTITGATDVDGTIYLELGSIDDFGFRPGLIFNANGKCVGILFASEMAIPMVFSNEAFGSGSTGATPAPSESPKPGGGGGGSVINDPGTDLPDAPPPSPSPSPAATEEPPKETSSEETYTLICYDGEGAELFRYEDTNEDGFAEFELPAAPGRNGYTFRGWADTKGGSAAYSAGEKLRLSEAGTKTVYAVYEKTSMPVWAIALIAAAAVGLIVGIIVLITKQKKTPPPPPNPGNETIGYTEPIPAPVPEVPVYMEPPAPPVPPQPARLILRCTGGYQDGRSYPIGEGPLKIGRTAECAIRYPDGTPGVSHLHAVLFWRNGVLMLQDTSSTDTYLKRTGKLVKDQPVPVNVGDVFYVGERKNRFEIMRG